MTRRTFLATASLAAAQFRQPNLVLFISDDHAYFDSPVYGNHNVRTPTLQRLASEGMTFSSVFAGSPSCVPSRAVIMSGMMPVRNGAEANHSGLKPTIRTLPTYLKSLGYRTLHFGKSHFQPASAYPDMEFIPSETKGEGPLNNDLDTAALSAWLEANPTKQPLCLIIGCHSPHVYWMNAEGYDPAKVDLPATFIDTPETRDHRARYYTEITKMDTQLGVSYNAVRKALGDNTLFIYTSDNGPQWPFAKWTVYDAGIHMPFIAVWPGHIKPRSHTDTLISFTDLLPTFIEAAGGKPPTEIDGQSFLSVLTGKRTKHRDAIYASHANDGDWNVYPARCIRTSRYKYILNLHPEFEFNTHINLAGSRDGKEYWLTWIKRAESDPKAAAIVKRYHQHPREELYDISSDPHEQTNLASDPKHASTLEDLRTRLAAWMKQQGDEGRFFGKPRYT